MKSVQSAVKRVGRPGSCSRSRIGPARSGRRTDCAGKPTESQTRTEPRMTPMTRIKKSPSVPSVKPAKSVVKDYADDLPDTGQAAAFSELIGSSFDGPRFSQRSYSAEAVPTICTTDGGFDGSVVLNDSPCVLLVKKDPDQRKSCGEWRDGLRWPASLTCGTPRRPGKWTSSRPRPSLAPSPATSSPRPRRGTGGASPGTTSSHPESNSVTLMRLGTL